MVSIICILIYIVQWSPYLQNVCVYMLMDNTMLQICVPDMRFWDGFESSFNLGVVCYILSILDCTVVNMHVIILCIFSFQVFGILMMMWSLTSYPPRLEFRFSFLAWSCTYNRFTMTWPHPSYYTYSQISKLVWYTCAIM